MRTKGSEESFGRKLHPLFLEGERKFIWIWAGWTFNPFIANQKYDMKNIPLILVEFLEFLFEFNFLNFICSGMTSITFQRYQQKIIVCCGPACHIQIWLTLALCKFTINISDLCTIQVLTINYLTMDFPSGLILHIKLNSCDVTI